MSKFHNMIHLQPNDNVAQNTKWKTRTQNHVKEIA
jgi:hypothetical protein